MMDEWKADQVKREVERKAHQEDLHKMMKEMMDTNQAKVDARIKEIKDEIKEDMNTNKKS
jgi:DNA-binding transcriptional regulator YbjK